MKHLFISFCLIFIFTVVMLRATAETADDDKSDTAKEAQTQEQTAKKPAQTQTPVSPDSFTPSEEISEDLSVSFPVDI